jgi:hypothetical protein
MVKKMPRTAEQIVSSAIGGLLPRERQFFELMIAGCQGMILARQAIAAVRFISRVRHAKQNSQQQSRQQANESRSGALPRTEALRQGDWPIAAPNATGGGKDP